jgi:hypothetical protein
MIVVIASIHPPALPMKSIFNKALFAIAGAALFASPAGAVATSNGDLLIGFYQVVGGTVQANTYVFNLGQASIYRENTQVGVSVSSINPGVTSSNIGTDLVAAFGSDWSSSGSVYWTILGGRDQTTVGVVNGDNARTDYISVGMGSTAPGISGTPRGTVANSIEAIRISSNGSGLAGINGSGATIPIAGNAGTLDEFFPPNSVSQLGIGAELRGLFGAGTVAGTNFEGALDVYRYVNSVTDPNMDLTSGLGNGNAALGTGQYIGTFTIDSAGNLGVIPEPSSTALLGMMGSLALFRRSRRQNPSA